MPTVFTLGHSTRDLADFSRVLQAHEIRLLVDIRAMPASRRHPHFNRDHLELWLPEIGADYLHEKDLGGKRGPRMPISESPHVAIREEAFRNYADYMLSPRFERAVERLVKMAAARRAAIMCAERDYLQCHRRLVSDYLLAQGHTVLHIVDEKEPAVHRMSSEARVIDGRVIYRGDFLF